jgi:hypothetical protein
MQLALPSPDAPEWDDVSPRVFAHHAKATVDLFIDRLEAYGLSDEHLFIMRREMDNPRPDKRTRRNWRYDLEVMAEEIGPNGEFFLSNRDLKRALYITLVLMIRRRF